MRQIAVVFLAALVTGCSGSQAMAQSRAFEVQESQVEEPQERGVSTGSATVGPDEVRTISEEEFLAPLLRAESPWIRSLGEALGARRADLELSTALDEPEVTATQEDLASGDIETEASVSWQLPRPARRSLDIERAAAELTAAESSFERSVLDLRLDLRRAYAEWAIATRRIEVLEIEANLLRELAQRSEERGQVGEVSGMEVRRLRLAEMEIRARAAVARSELATARAEVAAKRPDLVGALTSSRPLMPELPPAPTSEPPKPPAVAALEAELRASQLATELGGRVAKLPAITLGWKRVEPDGSGPSIEGPVVGLSWPIPLLSRGRAERLRAEARQDALEAQLDLIRSQIKAELGNAAASYGELRGAASDAAAALADADPTVRAASAAFRLGEGDLTTLLDAIRTATAARLAALELLSRALASQRRLERVRGLPFPSPEPATKSARFPS